MQRAGRTQEDMVAPEQGRLLTLVDGKWLDDTLDELVKVAEKPYLCPWSSPADADAQCWISQRCVHAANDCVRQEKSASDHCGDAPDVPVATAAVAEGTVADRLCLQMARIMPRKMANGERLRGSTEGYSLDRLARHNKRAGRYKEAYRTAQGDRGGSETGDARLESHRRPRDGKQAAHAGAAAAQGDGLSLVLCGAPQGRRKIGSGLCRCQAELDSACFVLTLSAGRDGAVRLRALRASGHWRQSAPPTRRWLASGWHGSQRLTRMETVHAAQTVTNSGSHSPRAALGTTTDATRAAAAAVLPATTLFLTRPSKGVEGFHAGGIQAVLEFRCGLRQTVQPMLEAATFATEPAPGEIKGDDDNERLARWMVTPIRAQKKGGTDGRPPGITHKQLRDCQHFGRRRSAIPPAAASREARAAKEEAGMAHLGSQEIDRPTPYSSGRWLK
ncbi:unnamed protein product [Phaeothamnion confervicola]